MTMIQVGSILIDENDKIGVVTDQKFNSHPLNRKIGDLCWIVRNVQQSQNLVMQASLVQIGTFTKWRDAGILVNPECYGIEALNVQEIEVLVAGKKLPYLMSKNDFLRWTETMLALAKDQHKFGQYDVGHSTGRCLKGTIEKAFFYFDITEEDQNRFNKILSELWGLGYI